MKSQAKNITILGVISLLIPISWLARDMVSSQLLIESKSSPLVASLRGDENARLDFENGTYHWHTYKGASSYEAYPGVSQEQLEEYNFVYFRCVYVDGLRMGNPSDYALKIDRYAKNYNYALAYNARLKILLGIDPPVVEQAAL